MRQAIGRGRWASGPLEPAAIAEAATVEVRSLAERLVKISRADRLHRVLTRVAMSFAALALISAAPADLPGWRGARWGMTEAELEAVFGDTLARLPGRWEYGNAYAERAMFGVEIDGLRFDAFFQMNDRTDRLQQVLLERRRPQATPAAYGAVLAALEAEHGPPDAQCMTPRSGGGPLVAGAVWRYPTTTVHATFMDFLHSGMLFEDPNTDRDVRRPYAERERIDPRSLPRRILLRFHPSERTDLMPPERCLPAPHDDGR